MNDDKSPFYNLFLTESLTEALQHPNSVNSSWMKEEKENLQHFKLSNDQDSAYWIDDDDGKLCMAFPAILDMNGKYGRLDPYFSLTVHDTVCFSSY
jgi:hypothetical protein